MRCTSCKCDKLSSDFFCDQLSDECDHFDPQCINCLVVHLAHAAACPRCSAAISDDTISRIRNLHVKRIVVPPETIFAPSETGIVTVNLLDGQSYAIPFCRTETIAEFKTRIFKKTSVQPKKQKLIFKGDELVCHVGDGANIQLIILLIAIKEGEGIHNVVFDLYWGYPSTGQDYLDGSCLAYANTNFTEHVDYATISILNGALVHSGDIITNTQGHHIIKVDLDKMPKVITKLFFILSAWNSPYISHFPNPSVRLYENSRPNVELCQYQITSVGNSQAVVMCCLVRVDDGWDVQAIGRRSSGNAKNYEPLKSTIQSM
eukprot:c9497_g1_i3.p1 GENE.c9497_g1_i3~~c9497_g1_i3.p1  ORF type:complete len:318 (-),score=52.82 c9497_g1_i3:57-1010(-)